MYTVLFSESDHSFKVYKNVKKELEERAPLSFLEAVFLVFSFSPPPSFLFSDFTSALSFSALRSFQESYRSHHSFLSNHLLLSPFNQNYSLFIQPSGSWLRNESD